MWKWVDGDVKREIAGTGTLKTTPTAANAIQSEETLEERVEGWCTKEQFSTEEEGGEIKIQEEDEWRTDTKINHIKRITREG